MSWLLPPWKFLNMNFQFTCSQFLFLVLSSLFLFHYLVRYFSFHIFMYNISFFKMDSYSCFEWLISSFISLLYSLSVSQIRSHNSTSNGIYSLACWNFLEVVALSEGSGGCTEKRLKARLQSVMSLNWRRGEGPACEESPSSTGHWWPCLLCCHGTRQQLWWQVPVKL